MSIDKARRNAFDIWKEFDDRIKLADKTVTNAEMRLNEVMDKIWDCTRKYDKSPRLHKLWLEWLSKYRQSIHDYGKNLGFTSHLGESYGPDFNDDKDFTTTYRDYWVEQIIEIDDPYPHFGTGNVTGAFNRFVVFEKYCTRAGFVDTLDEDGYAKIEKIIESCFDYLINEVEPKVRDYIKLMRFAEDKLEDAENSCGAYIDDKLVSK